jgi:hypothetical protein
MMPKTLQKQQQKHAPGNNYPVDKFKTVSVLLQREGDPVNAINGQYFFPEMPDLNNKLIKGISITSLLSGAPNYSPIGPNQGIFYNGYITLYNFQNEQIIYNMPLYNLLNENPTIINYGNKILPINAKLNIKLCYVKFSTSQNLPLGLEYSLNLNFFYDYK